MALPPGSSGILFTNLLPLDRHLTNQILLNGSGVAAGDLDGDGLCDLVFAGLGGRTTLYRNLGGWRFEDVTRQAASDLAKLDASGAVTADVDGDGDLDVILNTVGQGTLILENQGGGRLAPSAASPWLNPGRCGTSSALADVDGDGDLDLYIANYRVATMRDEPHLGFTIGREQGQARVTAYGNRPITDPDLIDRFKFHYQPTADGGGTVFHDEQGEADLFLRNEGKGRMVPLGFTNGVFLDEARRPLARPPFDWGLSVLLRDLNGDGAPDIYVCNDFSSPDRVWMNDGSGKFHPLAAHAIRQSSLSTMAVDVADLNRDGYDDIFTADMLSPARWRRMIQIHQLNPNLQHFADVVLRPQTPRNTVQLARGDGTYAEVAQMLGLEASDWSWASAFVDVDLDGFEDLLVCNGFERDFMNMDAHRRVRAAQATVPRGAPVAARLAPNRLYPRLATENLAYRNLGGRRFVEMGRNWGFNLPAVSQGMCLADLDNDGDLDVAINNLNGPAAILRNESTAPRLAIRLRGEAQNTRGIGARIRVTGGPVKVQTQEMIAGGRYLSGDEPLRVFAAGTVTNSLTVEVRWRSGRRSVLTNLAPNLICEISESGAVQDRSPSGTNLNAGAASASALFTDVSERLNHVHQPAASDEFEVQPMLPARLGTGGPGIGWFDLDGDGWDELLVPSGASGSIAVFRNQRQGQFRRETDVSLGARSPDQSAVVGWQGGQEGAVLLTGLPKGSAGGVTNAPVAAELRFRSNRWDAATVETLPESDVSTGPLALADIDGDGDLDLFVGGRHVPGRWPTAASSCLYRRESGRWLRDVANSNLLHGIGLVSDAVFTDLDGDNDPDLVLSCEWGPLRLLVNDAGRFRSEDPRIVFTRAMGQPGGLSRMSQLTGWWNGVSAGDFDGDGRLDLAASNWGRNTRYERFRARPLRIYYGDFIGDGRVDILESWFDPELGYYTPARDVWTLSRSLPWLLARFNSYEAFSRVNVETALGEHFPSARQAEAAWLDNTVFLNRGDRFEVRMLPDTAQVSPAFATCVADFDGDGHEDLFLAQNFFGVRPEFSRLDAGRGLILRGDGRGDFAPMPGNESGVAIYGEQRGATICDFDHDGRVDLAVTQHGDRTRLLRNESATPGLRIRLQGPIGNPQAVGARVRLKAGGTWGPVREIHAGGGYWSQNSAVQVMARGGSPTEVQVQWPGGKVTEVAVASGTRELTVAHPSEK